MRWYLLSLLLCTAPFATAMNKCVDAAGNVTYSQTACDAPLDAAAPLGVAVGPESPAQGAGGIPVDDEDSLCGRVRGFALELAWAAQQRIGADQLVASLGGRDDSDRYDRRGGAGTGGIVGDDVLEIVQRVFALASQGAETPAQIADAVARQCVEGRIDFDRRSPGGADGLRLRAGSGILLNPQGLVLTADRLVTNCRRLRVSRGGAWYQAGLVRRDPDAGLIVLLADGLYGRPAVFALDDAPPEDPLFAVTLPLRGVLTGDVGIAAADAAPSGSTASPAPSAGDSTPAGAGASGASRSLALEPGPAQDGAPLLDSAGLVAGMVLLPTADGAAPQAVPASALRSFLSSADIAHYSAVGLGKLTRDELRRRAAGFAVHVECQP